MKATTFTSTIKPSILAWATDYAKETDRTRREILEEALIEYKEKKMKELLKNSFIRAAKDTETTEMTEWGMEDYAQITNR